ncbi:MAG: DUF4197 domain-containing protein [Gammaproteobacteria bacterium]|nr:DUF4197 domain-containing protein [Gammaproteobacteria bacterium]
MRHINLKKSSLIVLASLLSISGCKELQPILDTAGQIAQQSQQTTPSQVDTQTAIKQALSQGIDKSIQQLGTNGGFSSGAFRIPLPGDLQKLGQQARDLGLGRYVDDFEMSMNRAAEKAVPIAKDAFKASIQQMTLNDVVSIMRGSDNAATQYFERTMRPTLTQRFLPIVARSTDAVGVTKEYKDFASKVSFYATAAGINMPSNADLDQYVTQKATDALFTKVADVEKSIRQDPWGQASALIRQVFGYYRNN